MRLANHAIDEHTLRILHDAFADACARFSAQLLKQLEMPTGESGVEGFVVTGGEAEFAEAPDWVKREYVKSKQKSDVAPEPMHRVSKRVARNQIVVKLWEAGISQKELAKRAGLAPNSISRILKDPERTRVDTLRKIAAALDVDISEIL